MSTSGLSHGRDASELCECAGVGRRGKDGGRGFGSEGTMSAVAIEKTLSSCAVSSSHSQVMVGLQAWERTFGFLSTAGEGVGMGSEAGTAAVASVAGASS